MVRLNGAHITVQMSDRPLDRRGGTYASYALSRDGERFLTNLPPSLEETLPITVVMNWTSTLRR
jgi:hypothetical protein